MIKPSNNVSGKDNQQERLKAIGWVVGFIDGEGCFSVSLHKNPTTKLGWQIMPEFVATQGEKSLKVLEKLQSFFDCGRIFVNRRHDNHKENLYRFCVRSFIDLKEKIVPFFRENKLQTAKSQDFETFAKIIDLMNEREHLSEVGIKKIIGLAKTMNSRKRKNLFENPQRLYAKTRFNAGYDIVRTLQRCKET